MVGVSLAFRDPHALTDAERDGAFALSSTACTLERAWFEATLARYDEVILYRERGSDRLIGLTGIRLVDSELGGQASRIIYTGSVTIDPAWRGHGLVPWAGIRTVLRHGVFSGRTLYWLMETDSWRAYARAVSGCRDVWPRAHHTTEPELALLDRLSHTIFGADWDPTRRVCRPIAARQLRPELAFIPPRVLARNAHAREFAELNRGYAHGEALPVLARLDSANMAHILQKMLSGRRDEDRRRRVEKLEDACR